MIKSFEKGKIIPKIDYIVLLNIWYSQMYKSLDFLFAKFPQQIQDSLLQNVFQSAFCYLEDVASLSW